MKAEDDLLARELGKVGASGGRHGGGFLADSLAGAAGGLGGYLGASLAARFLPTERCQLQLELRADPRTVLARAYSFIAGKGRIVDAAELRESPYPTVSGVVGSGILNLNPAVVHAEIVATDGDRCRVVLSGAAKEGLIKQRTAEKAVQRLAEALQAPG